MCEFFVWKSWRGVEIVYGGRDTHTCTCGEHDLLCEEGEGGGRRRGGEGGEEGGDLAIQMIHVGFLFVPHIFVPVCKDIKTKTRWWGHNRKARELTNLMHDAGLPWVQERVWWRVACEGVLFLLSSLVLCLCVLPRTHRHTGTQIEAPRCAFMSNNMPFF